MVPLPVISPHYALRSLSSVASIPHAARLSYHWTACAVNWLNLRRTGGSTCSGQVAQATPDRRLRRTGIFRTASLLQPGCSLVLSIVLRKFLPDRLQLSSGGRAMTKVRPMISGWITVVEWKISIPGWKRCKFRENGALIPVERFIHSA